MTVRLVPIPGIPEVARGDDLAALIAGACRAAGIDLLDRDVLVVTQKAVSKAEGRVVPEGEGGRGGWVARETARVVARRGDLVIAETRHGFVCANAGVDASNVAAGFLTLLPEDPDASAERIRAGLLAATGRTVAVVVTDTFGRAWRVGVVNVAIGCAGLPALVDLRGSLDAGGRVLEATVVALADEVAAASGLVIGKADGVPAAVLRGLAVPHGAPPGTARDLVRPPQEDLFRRSPLEALRAAAAAPAPEADAVSHAALADALEAVPSPCLLLAVGESPAARRLLGRALPPTAGPRGLPAVVCTRAADREIAAAAAAVERLRIALHMQGLAATWFPPSGQDTAGELGTALGLNQTWTPAAVGVIGPMTGEDLGSAGPGGGADLRFL